MKNVRLFQSYDSTATLPLHCTMARQQPATFNNDLIYVNGFYSWVFTLNKLQICTKRRVHRCTFSNNNIANAMKIYRLICRHQQHEFDKRVIIQSKYKWLWQKCCCGRLLLATNQCGLNYQRLFSFFNLCCFHAGS